jgi:hypothetical protein
MRTLRAIAASLTADEVLAFDRAHEALLEELVSEKFDVQPRIHAHIFRARGRIRRWEKEPPAVVGGEGRGESYRLEA